MTTLAQTAVKPADTAAATMPDEILRLSGRMLEHARQGAWEALAGLELSRRGLIHRYFESSEPARSPQVTADTIARVLENDREIVSLVETGKSEFEQQFRSLSRNRKAHSAYASNAG